MPHDFPERLARGPILCDGAMGTELYARGNVPFDRCFDELNLTRPDLVRGIHLDYIQAGAEIIETNTFGANRFQLSAWGLDERVAGLNRQGTLLAKEARSLTGQHVFIAGSVGPMGRPLPPLGPVSREQARLAFAEQVQALAEAGVDLIILETFGELLELEEAVQAARSVTTASGLIQLISAFNGGTDMAGKAVAQPTSFLVGCAFNFNAPDLERELKVLERKLKAGARLIVTQPVYETAPVEAAWKRLGGFPVPALMGVLPLRSARQAEFLHNEVPGIVIPEQVQRALREAGDEAPRLGARLARELALMLRDKIAGVYFIPPSGRYEVVAEVLEGVR